MIEYVGVSATVGVALVDGGRVAASGFLYQYLRTLEAALVALSDERVYAFRVEGDPNPSEATDTEIVDFDLVDDQGKILLAAQVKSGGPATQLGLSATVRILVNLVNKIDAPRYELLTNIRLGAGTANLVQVLGRNETVTERRAALESILGRTRTREHLANLSDEHIRRLGRCKLRVDMRERAELNDTLRQALREARRRRKRGIGQQSSGLLLAYLQSEVHRRAASSEDAVWTMSELIRDISLDDQALAEALGARDWGTILGLVAPVPDVPRIALLTELADALEPYRPTGRTPSRCALTGLSGIGKSSLAVAYFAEYADAYEALYWIDASSIDTIVHDFRLLASHLGGSPDTDPRQLRSLVHKFLSTHAGRWMMVFDDAQTTAAPWIPRVGDGDVLITSIDSTFSVSASNKLAVTVMQQDEAVQLLTARLELTMEQAAASVDVVRQLAAALEYWPLALELAASYIRNCGYEIVDVPYYLDSLKHHSLDDQYSIPEGYPRTLVAAIDFAVETLCSSRSDLSAWVASDMLARACYLANRRIPIHLLVAASDPDLDTLPSDSGPVIIENPLAHEAVRALKRISFARRDQPLPRRETDIATSDYTIAINSVLQEVLRARVEMNQLTEWNKKLERLAVHLNTWLSSATHNGEADKAHALVPHATALTGHLRRLNITSNSVAFLIGNIASVYSGMKRSRAAVELLDAQLRILMDTYEPDEFLVHQARLHLAHALVADDNLNPTGTAQAIDNLEYIVAYCQRLALDPDTHRASSTFCIHSISVLDQISDARLRVPQVSQLKEVFIETLGRLPPTDLSDAYDTVQRVVRQISAGEHSAAERECRRLLTHDLHGSNIQLEIHRLLIESLINQQEWVSAKVEVDSFAIKAGQYPLYRYSVDTALHNIGLFLAGYSLLSSCAEPRELFLHLMSLPCFIEAVSSAQGEYRIKFDLLRLILASMQGSYEEIRVYTIKTRELALNDASITGNRGWSFLASMALDAAQLVLDAESASE